MIDVKELRIGAHILVNGVRAKVIDICEKSSEIEVWPHVFAESISNDNGEIIFDCYASENLAPIPLTTGLLEELGFHKRYYSGDFDLCAKYVGPLELGVWIKDGIANVAQITEKGDRTPIFGYSAPCKYLHELEAFIYLTTKQELIKD